jgi:Lrp/AsnC family leucine-responsive transcriptional regulator
VQLNNQELGFGLGSFYFVQTFSGKLQLFCDQLTDFPEINEVFKITGPQNHYEGGFSRSIAPTTIHRPAFGIWSQRHLILSDLKEIKLL